MSIQNTHSCSVCGRRIQIDASLIGSEVACPHCHTILFFAESGAPGYRSPIETNSKNASELRGDLMTRVESALERSQLTTNLMDTQS